MTQAASARPTPVITLISKSCQELLSNKTSLPTMPDVAARIHKAMSNPNWSISTIATIVKSDTSTTTYILQIANSALYAGVEPVREVERAISRIGLDSTRNLIMAHAVRSMFMTRSRILAELMRDTWQMSAQLAALSFVLARHCPRMSPEEALLAGLLQDIGVLPILRVLDPYQDQLSDVSQVTTVIDRYAPQVGQVLLKQWGFDAAMVDVARSRDDWMRDPATVADLADLVLLARLHYLTVHTDNDALPDIEAVPAFAKLPLGGVDPETGLELLHAERESVASVIQVLGANA